MNLLEKNNVRFSKAINNYDSYFGKSGKIKITAVDAEPEHLALVKEGVIDYLVGQKRELFTWLGAQFLFDMRHKTLPLSANDARAGVIPIPNTVITGTIEIDKNNVDEFIRKK